jgi:hypothetical protein
VTGGATSFSLLALNLLTSRGSAAKILPASWTTVVRWAASDPALLAYYVTRLFALSTVMILPEWPCIYHPYTPATRSSVRSGGRSPLRPARRRSA